MKNPIVILGVVIVVAVVGIGAFMASQNASQPDSAMMQDDTQDTKMEKTDDAMMDDQTTGSRYVEYTKADLDGAADNRRVLFFYASWCPTCIPANANFMENASRIPEDVTVIRVNYNDPETDQEEEALAQKYGITYQHTFVQIDSEGNEVTKWNGGQTEELLANIR